MRLPLKTQTISGLSKVFVRHEEILAAYLFGSRIADNAALDSDIDLAVFVKNRHKTSEMEVLKLITGADISIPYNLDISCADLSSPPIFLYQIIKSGVCIYEKKTISMVNLEATIMDIYFDNRHLRNIYHHYLHNSFKEKTYGRRP